MEIQIKLSVRVMTDEIADAPQKNHLLHVVQKSTQNYQSTGVGGEM